MKINWGNGIVIAFVLFCSFIVAMVWKSFQQDVNLVSENYYQEELAYQNTIDAQNNARLIEDQVSFDYQEGNITIDVPQFQSGKLHLYRPDDKDLDVIFPISEVPFTITDQQLQKGRYIAKITWRDQSRSYHITKDIYIQ